MANLARIWASERADGAGRLHAPLPLLGALVVIGATSFIPNSATWTQGWTGWMVSWGNALLLCLALAFAPRPPATGPNRLVAGLLVLLSALLVVSCLAAGSVAVSLAALGPLAWLLGLAVLSARISPPEWQRITAALALWGVALCALGLWRWLMQEVALESAHVARINALLGERAFAINWSRIRNGHPFGHQNYLAGVVLLLVPLWLGQAASGPRWLRLAAWTGLGLGGLTLWSTQTRAAAPALAVMLALLLAWTGRRRVWSRRVWTLWLVVGGTGVGWLVAANPRNQALAASGTGAAGVWRADVRHQMLDAGRLLLQGHGWTGIGPGAVSAKYPAVRGRIDAGLEANYQLHDTPLQLAVELGWPASLAILALLAATFALWWRIPVPSAASQPPTAVWAGIAVFGYAAYSVTDYQLDVTAIAGLFGLALGRVWSGSPTTEEAHPSAVRLHRVARVCGLLLLAAALAGTGWIGRARWTFHRANSALARGDGAKFSELAAEAHRQDPSDPFYPEKIAAWHIERLAATTNTTGIARESAAARHWLETALEQSPDSEYAHFNLGWLLLEVEPRSALAHFQRAAHLVPDRRGVYLGCALALARLEEPRPATEALALELVLYPGFLATFSPWRNEPLAGLKTPAVREAVALLHRVADEAGAATPEAAWFREKAALIAWLAGGPLPAADEQRFRGDFWNSLAGKSPPVAGTLAAIAPWTLVYQAWKEPSPDRAKRLLAAAAYLADRTIPSDATLDTWLTRVRLATWSEVVRSEPAWALLSGYRRQRSGYNLIARHAEGARPADIPTYEENRFFETFFGSLAGFQDDVPSPVVLRELDRIVAPARPAPSP